MKSPLLLIFSLIILKGSVAQQYLPILHQKGLIDSQFLKKPEITWSSLLSSSINSCAMIPLQLNLPELEMNCYRLDKVYTNPELNIFNTPIALTHIFPNLYCEKKAQPYVFFHGYRIDTIWDETESLIYDPETFEEVLKKGFQLIQYPILYSFDTARFEKEQVRCTSSQVYDVETFEYGGYRSNCTGSLGETYDKLIFQHWAYLDTTQAIKSYPTALELHVATPNDDNDHILKFVVPIYSLPKTLDSLDIIWAGRLTITEEISGLKMTSKDSLILLTARQKQSSNIWKDALGKVVIPEKSGSSEITKLGFLYDFYLERNGKFYASLVGASVLSKQDGSYFIYFPPPLTAPQNEPILIDSGKKNKKKYKAKTNKNHKK